MHEDRSPSLEQGLRIGYSYASTNEDDRDTLRRIAKAGTAADITAIIDAGEIEPDGISDAVAFWSGFAHGVATFLVEKGMLLLDQPPGGFARP